MPTTNFCALPTTSEVPIDPPRKQKKQRKTCDQIENRIFYRVWLK